MKKNLLLLAAVLCCTCGPAFGWGKAGHDAIAYIAECNLTPRAKKNIARYLDGRSIVYYSSWMDQVRFTDAYKHTSGWHADAVDAQCRYVPAVEKGDAVLCAEQAAAVLKEYRHQSDSLVRVSILYLVHLVGDMHCPSHVKFPWYKKFKFNLNGRECDFHSYWDAAVLEMNHLWGYMEYAHQLDRCTKAQKRELMKGTFRDWVEENARDSRTIHEWIEPGVRLDKKHTNEYLAPTQRLAEQQIRKAGYRLARILNELFG